MLFHDKLSRFRQSMNDCICSDTGQEEKVRQAHPFMIDILLFLYVYFDLTCIYDHSVCLLYMPIL